MNPIFASLAASSSLPQIVVEVKSSIIETILTILGSGLIATFITIIAQSNQEKKQFKFRVLADFWGYRGTLLDESVSGETSYIFLAAQSQIYIAFSKNKKVMDLNRKLSLMVIDKIPGSLSEATMLVIKAMCEDLHVKIELLEERILTQSLYKPKK